MPKTAGERDSSTVKPGRFSPAALFMLSFTAVCLLLFALLEVAPERFYAPVNQLNARLSFGLLRLLGLSPALRGVTVSLGDFQAVVIGECSALFVAVLPLAFIWAFPAVNVRRKAMGSLLGLFILFSVNLGRISLLVYTGFRWPAVFDVVHIFAAQAVMILAVLAICLFWSYWVRREPGRAHPGRRLARFVLVSAASFTVWLILAEPYTRLVNRMAAAILAWSGLTAPLPVRELTVYPDTFTCFNMVTFTALMGTFGAPASRARLAGYAAGMGVLAGLHLLFKTAQALFMVQDHHPHALLVAALNILLGFQ